MEAQERVQERMAEVQERMAETQLKIATRPLVDGIAGGLVDGVVGGVLKGINRPFVFAQRMSSSGRTGDDRLYSNGQTALENRHWDQALEDFTQVAAHGGSRADGALYWKAYTLNKLGRRDEALAAIADLRKSYPNSRWLDDSKALEIEVKQASGQKVSPEAESDEELKLLALNGLVHSDPDRALPLLENLLKSAQSPKLKRNALYVLAESSSPRAQQIVQQVARGGGNPDLQLKAIGYLADRRRDANTGQMLFEIYSGSSDVNVKRAVLNAFGATRDKDHLLQIAKTDKSPQIRTDAIQLLGGNTSQADLLQLYQSETDSDVKQTILYALGNSAGPDRLIEAARGEKDAKLRRTAIRSLSRFKTDNTASALVAMYGPEQDRDCKLAIIDALYSQGNAKALVDAARTEKDPAMIKTIVNRLGNMKSKEAADYLIELVNK